MDDRRERKRLESLIHDLRRALDESDVALKENNHAYAYGMLRMAVINILVQAIPGYKPKFN